MKNQPKIIIRYNRFLDPLCITYVKADPRYVDIEIPSKELVLQRVETYKEVWNMHGLQIVEELQSVLGLLFQRNIIDVHIVSVIQQEFSRPIVIKSRLSPDEFIMTLTHELIHRIQAENSNIVLPEITKKMFPNESSTTRNHVLVHAVLTYIYLEVLKKEKLLLENKNKSEKHNTTDYTRAWEIVEEIGYKDVISMFKKQYKKIRHHT